ncbi:hypothetical protein LCGC14_1637320 [marine sediment metagenome]|uniref:Uncharacterized protein n=1 Tax=marine sediment metagenome TaxID=412755 RepID=A0A0F9IN66_9ZZZZ
MISIIWQILLLLIAIANFTQYLVFDGDVVNVVFGCTAIILLALRSK